MPASGLGCAVMSGPPDGFVPISFNSAFMRRLGNIFMSTPDAGTAIVGCHVGAEQANSKAVAHGGFLLGFADIAMCTVTGGSTVSMSADFLRPARVGDWITAEVFVRKKSERLLFADTLVIVGTRHLLRASGIFRPRDTAT